MTSRPSPPAFSKEALSIAVGSHYKHYKGMEYAILAIARHSETLEELVVYQALYGERGVWVRPVAMFLETVTVEGDSIARFRKVSE